MTEDRIVLPLWNWTQAYQQLLLARDWIKSRVTAGHRLVMELRMETRSDKQNRLLHSRVRDVHKHFGGKWKGEPMDLEDWKRLFVQAWGRVHNQGVRMLPALDGHGWDAIYRRTSKLSRRECADLSDYILAWGSMEEVKWCPASLPDGGDDAPPPRRRTAAERADAETGEILEPA
jgi:hypothetical protein